MGAGLLNPEKAWVGVITSATISTTAAPKTTAAGTVTSRASSTTATVMIPSVNHASQLKA